MNEMRAENSVDRPNIMEVLANPYFWNAEEVMGFLTKIHSKNDGNTDNFKKFKEKINSKANIIFGPDINNWTTKIDVELLENINQRRVRNPLSTVFDLVTSIRNKVRKLICK